MRASIIRTLSQKSVGSAGQLRAIQNQKHGTTVIVTSILQVSHVSNTCILCVKILILKKSDFKNRESESDRESTAFGFPIVSEIRKMNQFANEVCRENNER